MAEKYGITLPDLFGNATYAQFFNGEDVFKNPERSAKSLNEIQNAVWRRILSDIGFSRKTRGTIDSVKAVFRNSGIEPDNLFLIREYGGAKERSLDASKRIRKDTIQYLNFSGSYNNQNTSTDANTGIGSSPILVSSYLSSSRVEIGLPSLRGSFVQKTKYPPHGISNNSSDGLLTTSSFTYQANYFIDEGGVDMSLARINVTGSSAPSNKTGCVINLRTDSSTSQLILSVNDSPTKNVTKELKLDNVSLADKDNWAISFGYEGREFIEGIATGSYFIRASQYVAGEKIKEYFTSSYFSEHSDSVLRNISSGYNASGSFITIGSQSLNDTSLFLNSSTADSKQTYFSGRVANISFWSHALDKKDFVAFAKNHNSTPVLDPASNYNYNTIRTGSFSRARILTFHKQATTNTDEQGNIRLFDFSKNNLHLDGQNFETSKNVFKHEYAITEELSSDFDLNIAKTKVRIRSLQDITLLDNHEYAQTAPIYEVNPREEVMDDTRFSIDFSVMKGLNQNILGVFSDFSALDDALGRPNLVFATEYPDLTDLRRIYFENLLSKLDLGRYYDLFRWIDSTYTELVYELLPKSTNFLGINFVYESHVLERHKLKYNYDEIYLKALPRDPNRGNIFLSQFVAKLKKR